MTTGGKSDEAGLAAQRKRFNTLVDGLRTEEANTREEQGQLAEATRYRAAR